MHPPNHRFLEERSSKLLTPLFVDPDSAENVARLILNFILTAMSFLFSPKLALNGVRYSNRENGAIYEHVFLHLFLAVAKQLGKLLAIHGKCQFKGGLGLRSARSINSPCINR